VYSKATPDIILYAYHQGVFPMAESADDQMFNFYRPEMRGILPIDNLHIPKKLLKTVQNKTYSVTINQAFDEIIDGCALSSKGRENTWINNEIRNVFIELHALGYAHSVECWEEIDSKQSLAGGLYGLALGQVFCGESMVSFAKDASKVALIHLCARLYCGGFRLLDTQYINDHLKQFGAYEMPQEKYEEKIKGLMKKTSDFILEGRREAEILENYLTQKINVNNVEN
jgi:leucyl/phenylalanyl-tRNA--protein transferase